MLELNSDNKGTWFYFDPDNKDAGGVCLQELTSEEFQRIERLTVKTTRKFKRGAWITDDITDEKLAARLRWEFCIVDWDKVSIDGNEVQCNKENKIKAMKIVDFVKILIDNLEELSDTNKALTEARVKNLPDTSDS